MRFALFNILSFIVLASAGNPSPSSLHRSKVVSAVEREWLLKKIASGVAIKEKGISHKRRRANLRAMLKQEAELILSEPDWSEDEEDTSDE